MLSPSWDTVRLTLHVLAASVWVGGQITLAGLVPAMRKEAPEVLAKIARQFARLSWPAFVVLLLTGIWNVVVRHPANQSGTWNATLDLKIAIVLLSGASAWLHTRSKSKVGLAVWGAISSLSAITALFFGVLLAG